MPEIPASASGVASTDDDEEEDEGHYDIISRSRRAAATSSNSRLQKPRFCHPYEVVAGDSDSTYAGIRDELEAVISHRNRRLAANDPDTSTAPVSSGVSDALYAGIRDNGTSVRMPAAAVAVLPGITSTFSAANPQRFHIGDHGSDPDASAYVNYFLLLILFIDFVALLHCHCSDKTSVRTRRHL